MSVPWVLLILIRMVNFNFLFNFSLILYNLYAL